MTDEVRILLEDVPDRKLLKPVEVATFFGGIRQNSISLVRHGTYGKC